MSNVVLNSAQGGGGNWNYHRMIQRSRMVGSEDYNAPEIISEEIYPDISLESEIN
jgi:hypothetical protein